MPMSLTYDSLGNPTVSVDGDLPDIYPSGAAWMLLGGGGGTFQAEYNGAMGWLSGAPTTGLRWGAVIMQAGPEDQVQTVADWTLSAALYEADGTPIYPLACQVVSATEWAISFSPPSGARRVVIVGVTARKPGVTPTLRTPGLILIAGS